MPPDRRGGAGRDPARRRGDGAVVDRRHDGELPRRPRRRRRPRPCLVRPDLRAPAARQGVVRPGQPARASATPSPPSTQPDRTRRVVPDISVRFRALTERKRQGLPRARRHYGVRVADFVLRNVRIVELGRGPGWAGPVDVVVEQGVVQNIGHGLDRPAGIEEYDARRPLADPRPLGPPRPPRPVDRARPAARPRRHRVARARALGPGARPARARTPDRWSATATGSGMWQTEPTVAALDAVAPDVPVVLIAGDGHHAWLNSRALSGSACPRARASSARTSGTRPTPGIDRVVEPDALARGVPAHPRARGRPRHHRHRRPRARSARPADWEPRDVAGPRPRRDVRRRRSTRPSPPGCAPATRSPGRRTLITMGPLKIISDGSLNTRTAWCCEEYADGVRAPARPTRPAPSWPACSTLAHAPRPRGGHPRDR